jgi:hypothetical protein
MQKLALLWLASLVFAAVVASAVTAWAQAAQGVPATITRLPSPVVLSGADVGFRVVGRYPNGTPVGSWVIRLNGDWVDASAVPGLR